MIHKYAQIGDTLLHYVEEGEGPLVVLIHGFPEFWYSWRHQIPALAAAGFRVVAIDLRGYNETSKPPEVEKYRIVELVKDVAGLIVQLGETPCAVVAHDWGGVVAWFLAMLHPNLVSKLAVLNAPHPVAFGRELRHSTEQKARASYQLFLRLPVLPAIFLHVFGGMLLRRLGSFTREDVRVYQEAWRKRGAMRGMLNYYRAIAKSRSEVRALVRPIEVPTILIWGEKDPVFTRATTENFGEYVPHLRIERIADAGHFVQSDAPQLVNELLLSFLRA